MKKPVLSVLVFLSILSAHLQASLSVEDIIQKYKANLPDFGSVHSTSHLEFSWDSTGPLDGRSEQFTMEFIRQDDQYDIRQHTLMVDRYGEEFVNHYGRRVVRDDVYYNYSHDENQPPPHISIDT